jgi:hypothetical protein
MVDFCVKGYEAGFSSYFKKNASTISPLIEVRRGPSPSILRGDAAGNGVSALNAVS